MTLTKREDLLLDYITAVIEDEEGKGILQDRESCQIILCGYFCEDLFSAIEKGRENKCIQEQTMR